MPSVPGNSDAVRQPPVTQIEHPTQSQQCAPSQVLHNIPVVSPTSVFQGKPTKPVLSRECDDRPRSTMFVQVVVVSLVNREMRGLGI